MTPPEVRISLRESPEVVAVRRATLAMKKLAATSSRRSVLIAFRTGMRVERALNRLARR